MDKVFPTGCWGVTRATDWAELLAVSLPGGPMREVFVSTLSQVVELGIFAAAAGALAVGMMHVR